MPPSSLHCSVVVIDTAMMENNSGSSPQVVPPEQQQQQQQGAPPAQQQEQDAAPDENGTNINKKDDSAATNNEEQQQQQQPQPASLLQEQQQQTAQPPNAPLATTVGGLPFALMGASPLQQQLSALAGLTNTTAAPTMAAVGQPFSQPTSFLPQQQQQNANNAQLLQGLNPQLLQQGLLLQQLGITAQAPPAQFLAGQQQVLGPTPAAPATQDQTGSTDSQQQLLHTAANQVLGSPQQQQQQQLPQVVQQQPQAGLNNIQQLQLMLMANPQMLQGAAGANLLALMGQQQQQQQQQPQQLFQLPGLAQPGLAAPSAPVNMNALLQAAAAPNLGSLLQNNANSSNVFKPPVPATQNKQRPTTTEVEWAEPFAGKGKKEPPFPLKLHQILSNPEFAECICWNSHGRSWRILKPPVFEQIVIPLYFR